MKVFRCILVLLSSTVVDSFHAVPVPLRSLRRSISSHSPFPKVLLPAAAADSGRDMESDGPILLPPADYSKPGHVVNLVGGDDSGSEVGHVMLNRKITLSFTCNVCDGRSTYQLDFPEFGRNLEEFMAKKGTPVKRVVMSKEGISHREVAVPSKDYPEINPHYVSNNHDEDGDDRSTRLPGGFDASSLLPGAHVGDDAGFPFSGVQPSRRQGGVGAPRGSEDPVGEGGFEAEEGAEPDA
ncbi:unnamed protein product [Scytosiphon promiscuus]